MTPTDLFLFGLGLGLGVALASVVGLLALRSRDRYLINKADPTYRTPVCINGDFYYVVPESEYVEHLRREQRESARLIGAMTDQGYLHRKEPQGFA